MKAAAFQKISKRGLISIFKKRGFKGLKSSPFFLEIVVLAIHKEKLDRVGPIDNRPSTNYIHHLVNIYIYIYIEIAMQYMNHDT